MSFRENRAGVNGCRWTSQTVWSNPRRVLSSQRRRRLVYKALTTGRITPWDYQPWQDASQLYEKLLPLIVFGAQNFELILYCEKRLLHARGLIASARCRDASIAPDPDTVRYVDELNGRIMR